MRKATCNEVCCHDTEMQALVVTMETATKIIHKTTLGWRELKINRFGFNNCKMYEGNKRLVVAFGLFGQLRTGDCVSKVSVEITVRCM